MSGSLIRSIDEPDFDRVLAINRANVPEVGPLDRERLAFIVAESAIALVVDADAGQEGEGGQGGDQARTGIAGFCLVLAPGSSYDSVNYRWFMSRYDDAMYLDRVAFDARVRGRGLGRALYAEVDGRMREQFSEMTSLTLEVNVDPPNDASLAFHRRLGFEEIGRQMSKGIEVSLMHRPVGRGGPGGI